MSLYYNNDNYELKEIDDNLVEEWRLSGNPKYDYYILAPIKPTEDAIWNNGSWIIPQPVVPSTVSARQVRIWLIQHGISLEQVYIAIDSIQDTVMRDITKVEWEYAPYIERNHPMLPVLAQALGLTEDILDQAFIEANAI